MGSHSIVFNEQFKPTNVQKMDTKLRLKASQSMHLLNPRRKVSSLKRKYRVRFSKLARPLSTKEGLERFD
jgi:hypothetical protein